MYPNTSRVLEENQARYHRMMDQLIADIARQVAFVPYGPALRRPAAVLAASGHPVAQDAARLLMMGALRPVVSHPGTWTCLSMRNPSVVYVVTSARCSCPHGLARLHGPASLCKHRMAATVLNAAREQGLLS